MMLAFPAAVPSDPWPHTTPTATVAIVYHPIHQRDSSRSSCISVTEVTGKTWRYYQNLSQWYIHMYVCAHVLACEIRLVLSLIRPAQGPNASKIMSLSLSNDQNVCLPKPFEGIHDSPYPVRLGDCVSQHSCYWRLTTLPMYPLPS